MRCKIADLIAEIPEAGDLVPRCRDYLYEESDRADIIIRTDQFQMDTWPESMPENAKIYLESGTEFYFALNKFNGMMLHASAVTMEGKAYLFSGTCGTGKSTHTRLWESTFGEAARVINDDKPALRRMADGWYAYGTPWCGKDGINRNEKAHLAGICFLKQAPHNRIRRLSTFEAAQRIISQTQYRFWKQEGLDQLLVHVNRLVQEIPVYELENRPEPEAAYLSYKTMRRGAEEIGL